MPQINDYQVDKVLTNLSIAYENMEFIADKVAPRLDVEARTGFYYVFSKDSFRAEDDTRTGFSRAKRVDYGMTKTAFGPLREHALEEGIEYEVRDTYPSPHDARVDATANVTGRSMLNQEKDLATILRNTSVMTQNITLSGTDRFNDYANSDPIGVIQTGMDVVLKACMRPANTIIMGYEVFAKLRNHPDLLNRLSTSTTRILTKEQMADIFGVEEIIVGMTLENTAVEGQTAVMGYVWGKDIIIAHIAKRPGLKTMSLAYTLQVKGARYVDRWDEPQVKAEFVRYNDYYQSKVVAVEAGYLIKTAID